MAAPRLGFATAVQASDGRSIPAVSNGDHCTSSTRCDERNAEDDRQPRITIATERERERPGRDGGKVTRAAMTGRSPSGEAMRIAGSG
jgi:hypothetical protein